VYKRQVIEDLRTVRMSRGDSPRERKKGRHTSGR